MALAAAVGVCALAAAPAGAREAQRLPATLFVKVGQGPPQPALALATEVEIAVSGLVARTRVTQRFVNRGDQWLQGVYVFPLPEMAAVDRLSLTVGERQIEGRIQEREAARRRYDEARAQGRKAALLAQERPNLFTTSVANIGPGEPVEIRIEYQQTLRYEASGFELRFPMTITPRCVPGMPDGGAAGAGHEPPAGIFGGLVAAASARPSPFAAEAHPLRLRVDLDAGLPLAWVHSPSHPVKVEERAAHRFEVRLREVSADRDFVLRWSPERGSEPRVALFSEPYERDHYALLMVLPPAASDAPRRLPREAVFVIDTSGSMAGASIEQARAALHLAIDRLAPGDRFNVVAFDDQARRLFPSSQAVSPETLGRAHGFVAGLEANGGTNMLPALQLALLDPDSVDAGVRQVVFVTDGSIGNEAELFTAIQGYLGRSRLFMVGIGSAPNAFFLNRAATFGRGTVTSIGSAGEVRERMDALLAKLERPVLHDLAIHWNDEVEAWPQRPPDLYDGEPVVVTARLQRFVGEVVITGRRGAQPFEARLPLGPGAPERGLHKLWARHQVAHWMALGTAGVSAERVRAEVLSVSLHHQIVSRFTSLVAVDATPTRPRGAPGATTRVPGAAPQGSASQGAVGGQLPQGATPAPSLLAFGVALLLLSRLLWRADRRRG
jgi:Ca-activated chloride channel family protein